jgi:lipoate---protein ligase
MLAICQETHDPFFNLAVEDYLLHNRKEDFLILSVNDPCVIIGKHQVAQREVNTIFTEEKKIPVIRRISGGGTVFHDRGNLNFAFIKQSQAGKQVDFRLYAQPVIDFLSSIGLNAVFEGKNDLTIDGLKISGNAEHIFRERVLHHGTLLFDASLDDMRKSIKAKSDCYFTHAVESNRTSVTNLKMRLPDIKTVEELLESMLNYFLKSISDLKRYSLSEEEKSAVRSLADNKYKTWEWNYGYGPQYTFKNWFEVNGKACQVHLLVKDGIIWGCNVEGNDDIKSAFKILIGCRHMYQDLLNKFHSEAIPVPDSEIIKFF